MLSLESKDLIRHLLIVDKGMRYKATDVLCHSWIITQGGSKEGPDDMTGYQAQLREELEKKAKDNMTEWKSNRAYVFANHDSKASQI